MPTLKSKEFNVVALIDSQKKNASPLEGKQERGVIALMQERNRISRHRAGVPLADEQLLLDLQLTFGSSGAALAGAVHNPLSEVAGAARPPSVLNGQEFSD